MKKYKICSFQNVLFRSMTAKLLCLLLLILIASLYSNWLLLMILIVSLYSNVAGTQYNIWNGSFWSKGTLRVNQNIEFNEDYAVAADIKSCTCIVPSGDVTILTTTNSILGGKLALKTPGTSTYDNDATLLQTIVFTGSNTGNITYKRANTATNKFVYSYKKTVLVDTIKK